MRATQILIQALLNAADYTEQNQEVMSGNAHQLQLQLINQQPKQPQVNNSVPVKV